MLRLSQSIRQKTCPSSAWPMRRVGRSAQAPDALGHAESHAGKGARSEQSSQRRRVVVASANRPGSAH